MQNQSNYQSQQNLQVAQATLNETEEFERLQESFILTDEFQPIKVNVRSKSIVIQHLESYLSQSQNIEDIEAKYDINKQLFDLIETNKNQMAGIEEQNVPPSNFTVDQFNAYSEEK